MSRAKQRGATAVELALTLPLFMSVLLGMLDWGYYFFVAQVVNNAAREAARAGAVETTEGAASSSASSKATTYLDGNGLASANANVDVTFPDATSVRVAITYTTGSLTGFLPDSMIPDAARASAEMRRQ